MSEGKIKIDLDSRIDSFGNKYYLAKVEAPILIDCREGAAFMIFTSQEGEEEMHICLLGKKQERKNSQPTVYSYTKEYKKEASSMPNTIEELDQCLKK